MCVQEQQCRGCGHARQTQSKATTAQGIRKCTARPSTIMRCRRLIAHSSAGKPPGKVRTVGDGCAGDGAQGEGCTWRTSRPGPGGQPPAARGCACHATGSAAARCSWRSTRPVALPLHALTWLKHAARVTQARACASVLRRGTRHAASCSRCSAPHAASYLPRRPCAHSWFATTDSGLGHRTAAATARGTQVGPDARRIDSAQLRSYGHMPRQTDIDAAAGVATVQMHTDAQA